MKCVIKILSLILMFLTSFQGVAFTEVDHDEILRKAHDLYYSDPDSSYKLCKFINRNELSKSNQADLAMLLARYGILSTDYEAAEKELLTAMSSFQELNDQIGVARVYGLQSILAERLGENEKAIELVKKSYYLYLELGATERQVTPLQNIPQLIFGKIKPIVL